jgi:hypothetical protein
MKDKAQGYKIFPTNVGINQLNVPNYIILYFPITMAPTCFDKTMPFSGSDYVPFWATSASI